jgi:hypothetical protein
MVSPQSKEKRKQLHGALTRLQGHEKYSRGQSHRFNTKKNRKDKN